MVAPIRFAIGPSFAIASSGSFGSSSMPRTSEICSRKSRTVGVTWIGNLCRPTRATASASAVTALSSLIIEPWPGRPFACMRSQSMPFSAVWIR